jgi:hypothetical protein
MSDQSPKVKFFDLETQYLFEDVEPRWKMMSWREKEEKREELSKKLRLAVAGFMGHKGDVKIFTEENIGELFNALGSSDLIVGHNLLRFDYLVLSLYSDMDVVENFQEKTFDIMKELEKITGILTSLDDLGQLNLGIRKSENSIKIPKMWRDGEHDRVIEYLRKDLEITKGIYDYGKTRGEIRYTHKEYGEIKGVRTVKVSW